MKYTTVVSLFFLLGTSFATSAMRYRKRQTGPPPEQVIVAIKTWAKDVNDVNKFLNNAPSQSAEDFISSAEKALISAKNEKIQLDLLASVPALGNDAERAVEDLRNNFDRIPESLQRIIDGLDKDSNLDIINHTRCCIVLPSLDNLWQGTAFSEGVGDRVALVASRPNACLDGSKPIDCSVQP